MSAAIQLRKEGSLYVAVCRRCGTIVGASRSLEVLSIAERAHVCADPEGKKPVRRAHLPFDTPDSQT